MEDDLMKGMSEWIKKSQEELEAFKKINDEQHEKLDEKQRKELDDALKSVDMGALNKTIQDSCNNIMNQINGMFK